MMTLPISTDAQAPDARSVSFPSGAYQLQGTLFHPGGAPKAAVVINAATGVRAQYYAAFASWLAETYGVACLTYDYRDFGASRVNHPRNSEVTMADWAVADPNAARHFLEEEVPNCPVWMIGHSLGALVVACQRDLDRVSRLISVASGAVHVSEHPWPYQMTARMFWFVLGPAATKLKGYLPGRAMGAGPDLPSGVYWQWRKWCTSRDFIADDIGVSLPEPDWTAYRGQARAVSILDDALVPPKVVRRSMQFHKKAAWQEVTLDPSDYGLPSIGHIGAFHPDNRACWPDIVGEG